MIESQNQSDAFLQPAESGEWQSCSDQNQSIIAFCHLLSNSIFLTPRTTDATKESCCAIKTGEWKMACCGEWPNLANLWKSLALQMKSSPLGQEPQDEFRIVWGGKWPQLQLQNVTLMYNNRILSETEWRILPPSGIPRDKGSSCNYPLAKRSANQGSGTPWSQLLLKLYHGVVVTFHF